MGWDNNVVGPPYLWAINLYFLNLLVLSLNCKSTTSQSDDDKQGIVKGPLKSGLVGSHAIFGGSHT